MPCGKKIYCAMCHNFEPSLTIIMDDERSKLQKINKFMSKNLHSIMCQF